MPRKLKPVPIIELEVACEATGMSKAKLAEHCGMTERAFYRYFSGERKIPYLLALEIVRLGSPKICLCATLPRRAYLRGVRCNRHGAVGLHGKI